MNADEELDRLYGLPLKEFVPERNALVRRLEAAGAREQAAEVKKLGKPSVSAWAINQLVRRRRDLVLDLIAAVDRLRAAQVGALEGKEDAPSLSEATKDERAALARIEDAAPAILDEAGYVASRATVERALRSLRAAASDPEGRPRLEQGRLTGDYEPAGFDPLTAQLGATAPPPPLPEARRARDTIDLEMEAARRLAELKRAEQEERRRLEEERRQAEEARRTRQRKMDTVRRTLEAAREAENRLEREHMNAQRERREAERRLEELVKLTEQVVGRLEQTRRERAEAEAQLAELKAEAEAEG